MDRLTLVFAFGSLLVSLSMGAWFIYTERYELLREESREAVMLGRGLQVAANNALRDGQTPDIAALHNQMEAYDAKVDLIVFDPDGRVITASPGAPLRNPVVEDVRSATSRSSGPTLRLLALPDPAVGYADRLTAEDGTPRGVLVLLHPLTPQVEDLRRTRRDVIIFVGLTVLLGSVLGNLVGDVAIRRPLDRLQAALAQVEAGDLHAEVPAGGGVEFDRVATSFAAMTAELRRARLALREEAEGRERLLNAVAHSDKLASMGQIAATVAHELATPLQTMIGRAELIAEDCETLDEARGHAGILVQQGHRLTTITSRLLGYVRRLPADAPTAPAADSLRQVLDLLMPVARRGGVTLRLDLPKPRPERTRRTDAVQQIAFNLISNAIHATPAGGRVTVTLARAEVTRHDALPTRDALVLEVHDTGPGIPAELIDHIFQPFITGRAESGGTGLGLAVVRTLVHELRGSVGFTQSPSGTTFTVHLPVAEVCA